MARFEEQPSIDLSPEQLAYEAAIARLETWARLPAARITGSLSGAHNAAYTELFAQLAILRAEISALTALLLYKGVCDHGDLRQAITLEANDLDSREQEAHPGVTVSPDASSLEFASPEVKARYSKTCPS